MTSVNEIPFSRELLDFYKKQCESLEEERLDFIKKLENYSRISSKTRDVENELRQREDEIEVLKKRLHEAQVLLFNEREEHQKLQHSNDQLRLENLESRRRIKDLLSLTEPIKEEITYFKDCRPEKTKQYYLNLKTKTRNRTNKNNKENRSKGGKTTSSNNMSNFTKKQINREIEGNLMRSHKKKKGSGPQRILRTVFLPNENVDHLVLEIESLKTQLEELQTLNDEKMKVFNEEQSLLVSEHSNRYGHQQQRIDELQRELNQCNLCLEETTKDLFVCSHNKNVELRTCQEERNLYKRQNENLKKQLEFLKVNFRKQNTNILQTTQLQSEELINKFRNESIENEHEILQLQNKLEMKQQSFKDQLIHKKREIEKWKRKYSEMTRIRKIDFEGFSSDISLLKKDLEKIESKMMKYLNFIKRIEEKNEQQKRLQQQLKELKKNISLVNQNLGKRKNKNRVLYV